MTIAAAGGGDRGMLRLFSFVRPRTTFCVRVSCVLVPPCVRVCACAFISVCSKQHALASICKHARNPCARARAGGYGGDRGGYGGDRGALRWRPWGRRGGGDWGRGDGRRLRLVGGPRACPGTDAGKMPEGRRDWIQGANGLGGGEENDTKGTP